MYGKLEALLLLEASRSWPWPHCLGPITGKCTVKAGVVCLQVKLCDPHLSALEMKFSRRGAIQIYVYLYLTFTQLQIYLHIHLLKLYAPAYW